MRTLYRQMRCLNTNNKNRVMSEIEKKVKEIADKWKSEKLKQNIEDFYKFYRSNKVMMFEDLEELWWLCKLEGLK